MFLSPNLNVLFKDDMKRRRLTEADGLGSAGERFGSAVRMDEREHSGAGSTQAGDDGGV